MYHNNLLYLLLWFLNERVFTPAPILPDQQSNGATTIDWKDNGISLLIILTESIMFIFFKIQKMARISDMMFMFHMLYAVNAKFRVTNQ